MNMQTTGEKIYQVFNYIILALIGLVTIYPFIYLISASVSDPQAVVSGEVFFLPKGFNLSAYARIMADNGIWVAYLNTIFYTVVGTIANMIFTICGAYALSKNRLRGRRFLNMFFVFTMWFNAGMIPFYLTLKDMSMLNNRWTLIIAFAINAFNVVLLRTAFESVPSSMEEVAQIDGANDLQILCKIYLHLIKSSIATISLFYMVNRWNGYFWAMVILSDDSKIPLQVLLKKLIVDMTSAGSDAMGMGSSDGSRSVVKETFIYATIVISVLPMMAVYPFIQKYFVKGVMVGAIKG